MTSLMHVLFAMMLPFLSLQDGTPAPQGATPPDNYRPQILDGVPIPGTDPNEVHVVWADELFATTDGPPAACPPDLVATVMVRFFTAWSEGDVATMKRYLAPSPPSGAPYIAASKRPAEGYLAWFGINPIPGGIADGSGAAGTTVTEILAAAAERHEQHEVIQVLQVAYGPASSPDAIGMIFNLARDADDIPAHIVGGKGEIDCETGRITVFSASDQGPAVSDTPFEGVEPITVPER